MIGDEDVEGIVFEWEIGRIGVLDGTIDVAIEAGTDVYGGDLRSFVNELEEMFFWREVENVFSVDGQMGLEEGFYEPLPVFAEAVGAINVGAIAGDDLVVIDRRCDVVRRVFRDEFCVGGIAEVALVRWREISGRG